MKLEFHGSGRPSPGTGRLDPMKSLRLLSLLLVVPAAFAATQVIEEIIVKVNGDIILRSDYDRFHEELVSEIQRNAQVAEDQKQAEIERRKKGILSDLIDERLLVQKGEELGINVEAQVLRQRDQMMERYELETVDEFEAWAQDQTGMLAEDMMARLRENALSQAVLGQEVGSRVIIRRDEIEEYYKEHEDEFIRSEGVRLAELLIADEPGQTPEETEKEAREIHDRVSRGEPFAEMARRYSDSDGSKAAGGDIGIWRRGSLQKEIEDRVFDKNTGHITELIKVQRGWLILKVTERRREGLADFDEVEEEIRNKLIGPRYGPAIRVYLTELREQAYIEIRPGYEDAQAAPNKDTAWSDPANLAPITTTREAVLERSRKRKLLWMIPMGNSALKEEIRREKAEKEAAEADVTDEN